MLDIDKVPHDKLEWMREEVEQRLCGILERDI